MKTSDSIKQSDVLGLNAITERKLGFETQTLLFCFQFGPDMQQPCCPQVVNIHGLEIFVW